MKKILAFLILACLLVSVVSCIDTKKKDDEKGTNAVVTDAEGSVVTDEKGDPETYPPQDTEETTEGEQSTGGIKDGGANTDDGYGPVIPIG